MCPIQIIRNRKAVRQHWLCCYCRQPMWNKNIEMFAAHHNLIPEQASFLQVTAEHLRPRSDGGRNSYANIAAACLYCNRMRHQLGEILSPADYREYVRTQLLRGRWHGIRIRPIDTPPIAGGRREAQFCCAPPAPSAAARTMRAHDPI